MTLLVAAGGAVAAVVLALAALALAAPLPLLLGRLLLGVRLVAHRAQPVARGQPQPRGAGGAVVSRSQLRAARGFKCFGQTGDGVGRGGLGTIVIILVYIIIIITTLLTWSVLLMAATWPGVSAKPGSESPERRDLTELSDSEPSSEAVLTFIVIISIINVIIIIMIIIIPGLTLVTGVEGWLAPPRGSGWTSV